MVIAGGQEARDAALANLIALAGDCCQRDPDKHDEKKSDYLQYEIL